MPEVVALPIDLCALSSFTVQIIALLLTAERPLLHQDTPALALTLSHPFSKLATTFPRKREQG